DAEIVSRPLRGGVDVAFACAKGACMSISTMVRSAVVVACVAALPVVGQYGQSKAPAKKSTPTPQTSTTGTPAATDTTGTMSTTTTKTTGAAKTHHPSGGTNRTRVWNDATRLAAILTDVQDTKVT